MGFFRGCVSDPISKVHKVLLWPLTCPGSAELFHAGLDPAFVRGGGDLRSCTGGNQEAPGGPAGRARVVEDQQRLPADVASGAPLLF